MAKGNYCMPMGMFTKGIESMIKRMERGSICIRMAQDTRVIGSMINKMDKAPKFGRMALVIKGSMRMGRNKEREC